ncbi:hypothetical protein HG536_0G01830 [Torulaspora globosa]|uniref:Uncharacterized protein n=1 Tax=Torulaspora globosa TaxID=48254 RepID=A0A7G3ZLD8_9SACH|nr:uncharacterized protein HG536_0G01830 [Torulaspora globosa]QLL34324.1 hypothetical protein HG536_0G01830 [Torulaspora globosa]
MSFTSFMRRRGSKSAIQATIAETSIQESFEPDEFEFGSQYQSVDAFDDVRVLNDPDVGAGNGNAASTGSRIISINTGTNYEIRSEELAILSTSSSSSSGSLLVGSSQQHSMIYSPAASNSQRIDEWCLRNELDGLTDTNDPLGRSANCSRVQNVVDSWGHNPEDVPLTSAGPKGRYESRGAGNYTSDLLKGLNKEELSTVKQLTKELLPLLRNSRRTHSVFSSRYRDIPSVFPQRDLIIACSLRYNSSETDILAPAKLSDSFSTVCLDEARSNTSLSSRAWLAWSLVPRLTESDLR